MTLVCRFCANVALLHLSDVIINESTDNSIDGTLLQRQQDRWSSAEAERERERGKEGGGLQRGQKEAWRERKEMERKGVMEKGE